MQGKQLKLSQVIDLNRTIAPPSLWFCAILRILDLFVDLTSVLFKRTFLRRVESMERYILINFYSHMSNLISGVHLEFE